MGNAKDFIVENGVLKKYIGPGGDVVIPEGVSVIGTEAFQLCQTIHAVCLPDSIASVGNWAFRGSSLTEISIPDGTEIGYESFYGCKTLQKIKLPADLEIIGESAFEHCESLTSVILPEALITLENGSFMGCSSLREVVFPQRLEEIGQQCFDQCGGLEKIVLPEGLRTIGSGAFARCGNLKYVDCADEVFRLFLDSFNTKNLMTVAYRYLSGEFITTATPDESFAKYIKKNSAKLFTLILAVDNAAAMNALVNIGGTIAPNAVESMLETAVSKQNTPAVTAWLLQYKTQNFAANPIKQERIDMEMNWSELYSIEEIDEKQVRLGKYTGTDVMVSVPAEIDKKKVTFLDGTFDGYAQVQAVELPKTLVEIGSSVFRGCTELHSITLPQKLKAIGPGAFENCTGLAEIEFPQTVSLLGIGVFQNCNSLCKVTLSPKIKKIPMNTFARCTALTEITIPEKCREIEFFAFDGCQNLRIVHISATVKSIGYEAFDNCPNLTIYAPAGSYAETWANNHKIPFVAK